MTASTCTRDRPPSTGEPGSSLPPGCRTALALEKQPGTGEAWLRRHPDLKRLFLVGPPTTETPRDSRIRRIDVRAPLEPALAQAFHEDVLCFAEGRVGLLLTEEDYRTEPALCALLSHALLQHTRQVLSTVALHATRGWHMMANALLNLPRALQEHAISELQGLAQGRPVVIVGAGPSLDRNVAELRAARPQVVIVACDAACATLVRAGVQPDWVVTTDDSERIWRYFGPVEDVLAHTPVICLLQSSWPVVRQHRGPLYVGLARSASGAVFHETTGLPFFDTGQCVGHAALEAALLLGGAPILMVGFDLGYSGDRFHPRDMQLPYFHLAPPPRENLTTVPGVDGKPVVTDLSMAMYLREFENRIAQAPVPVWDATEGGALKRGTRIVPLRTALQELAAGAAPAARQAAARYTPRTTFHDLKARWLRGIGKLLIEMDELISGPGTPDLHSFLVTHQEIVSLVSDADNWAEIAAFRYAWEDWRQHRLSTEELRQRALRQLNELAGFVRLVPLLLDFPAPTTSLKRALLVAPQSVQPAGRQPLVRFLETLGLEVIAFHGDPDQLPSFWEHLSQQAIDLLVSVDGSIMPAAWAMPGLPCLDWKTQPPVAPLLPEHWLPGYAILCSEPEIARAWRQASPTDRPVLLLSDPGLLHPAEAPDSIENGQFLLNRLTAEV